MGRSQCCFPLRTVLRIAGDLLRLVAAGARSHAQLAAENLFLRKQLALYVERQVLAPRHASLGLGIPDGLDIAPVLSGHRIREGHRVVAAPILGGLHHEYRLELRAA